MKTKTHQNWDEKTATAMIDRALEHIEATHGIAGVDKSAFDEFDSRCARAFRRRDLVELDVVCEAYKENVAGIVAAKKERNGNQNGGRGSQRSDPRGVTGGTVEKNTRSQGETQTGLASIFQKDGE